MSVSPSAALVAAAAGSAPFADAGQVLLRVAVPAAILGALVAGAIKRLVLSSARFRKHRPGLRTFVWVGIADLVAWAVLWPALLVVRLQGVSSNRGLWIVALMMVVALGYIANRYGFGKAFDPKVAGSFRGTMLAEFFTILMPVLGVIFGLIIYFSLNSLGMG